MNNMIKSIKNKVSNVTSDIRFKSMKQKAASAALGIVAMMSMYTNLVYADGDTSAITKPLTSLKTLVVAIIGAKFAYFSASVSGNGSNVTGNTLDVTGNIIKEEKVNISKEKIEEVINNFPKKYLQEVPKYSAIHVDGKRWVSIHSERTAYSTRNRGYTGKYSLQDLGL